MWDLRPNSVSKEKKKTVKAKKKRREEEEEEREIKKVWKLTLSVDFYDFWYGYMTFVWILGFLVWNSKVLYG